MNLETQIAAVAALFSIVLGIMVWFRRVRTRTTLPFSLLSMAFALFCTGKVFWLFYGKAWIAQVATAGGLFTLAAFFYLMVVYLAGEKRIWDFTVVGAFAVAGMASVLRFVPELDPVVLLGAKGASALSMGGAGALALFCIAWIVRSALAGQSRRMNATLAVLLAALAFSYLLEKRLRPGGAIQPWTLIFSTLFLYFLYQVVVQYRFFGLRELVGKIAVLMVSAIFLAAVFGLLIFLIGADFLSFGFHTLVAAFFLLLLYEPILSRVEAGTVRWLFRAGSEQRRKFGALARDLAGRISVEEAISFLVETVPGTLGFNQSSVYFLDRDFFARAGRNGRGPGRINSEMLRKRLADQAAPLLLSQLRREAVDAYPGPSRQDVVNLMDQIAQIPATVLLPLRYQERLLGFWAIDFGEGREPQSDTADVLLSLADQAALRIENARIYERLKIQDRLATVGEMAAGLAHEIRNPLGSMKGAAEYLKDENLPGAADEFVQIIIDEAGRLNQVLGRFLDFARPFKVAPKKHDMVKLIRRVISLLEADENFRDIFIETSPGGETIECMVDDELIIQVLVNLMKNAAEAMGKKGRIRLSVNIDATRCCIGVSDDGPGVAPEKLERLFEPFFSTKKGGTGLGLAISRKICQVHGGDLTAVSTPGEGMEFKICLPVDGPGKGRDRAEGNQ